MSELQKAMSKLKTGKSPGFDNTPNETPRAAQSFMNHCLLKLFNAFFSSSHYPKQWSQSFICPLQKLDDPKKPENYRGIAINNSIGKLFNIILCNRFDNGVGTLSPIFGLNFRICDTITSCKNAV